MQKIITFLSAKIGLWFNTIRARWNLVCYKAVFRVFTQCSSPLTAAENRSTFLSRDKPIIIQVPFSRRRSRHVCGTVTPTITALLLSVPPCVWMTECSKSSRKNKQLTTVVLSKSSPIQNLGDQQRQQGSRANCGAYHGCAHKVARYSFRKSLIDN